MKQKFLLLIALFGIIGSGVVIASEYIMLADTTSRFDSKTFSFEAFPISENRQSINSSATQNGLLSAPQFFPRPTNSTELAQ